MRAGLALNPATPLDALRYVIDDLDMLLIMTVNPGFGGQEYIPAMTEKVANARALIDRACRDIWLEVDGGITEETSPVVTRAGANVLVAGSSVFNHPGGLEAGIRALREACLPG
jgi:ribulose-phosphate 3-epimerase